MALSRHIALAASLMSLVGTLSACDGFKKVKDACSVTIAPRDLTVPVNATTAVIGTAYDCDGNSIPRKVITFSSNNNAVATVTKDGQVIGISVGTAIVSAVANGKSGDANVTVSPERVATVTLTPATTTLRRGQTLQLSAAAKNVTGNVISGTTVQWASSNSSLASVDNSGRVSALAPGVVNITATSDGQTGTSLITITEVPIGSCSLTPGSQKITVSNQAQFTLALRDTANNPLSTTGRALNYTSDNNLIASVSSTGVVTALKAGTARITASDQQNAATNCDAGVEVVNARIAFVNIVIPVNARLRVGVPRQYTVTLLDSNRTPLSATGRTVTWREVTPTIARVSAAGIVTPVAVGNGRVAVDAEGAVDTLSFGVDLIPVGTVVVTPLQRSVTERQTAQFTATVTDSAGNIVTDRTTQWTSSDVARATVDANGLVTTTAPGPVTITANTEGKQGQATLIILQVPVDTILVSMVDNPTTVPVRGLKPITIDLRDAAGIQVRNRTPIVTSDQPGIATATVQGTTVTISGVAVGTATITIQAVNSNMQNEGKATKVIVTVTPQ